MRHRRFASVALEAAIRSVTSWLIREPSCVVKEYSGIFGTVFQLEHFSGSGLVAQSKDEASHHAQAQQDKETSCGSSEPGQKAREAADRTLGSKGHGDE